MALQLKTRSLIALGTLLGLVPALFLVAGCQSNRPGGAAVAKAASKGAADTAREVQVVPAFEQKVTRAVEATGTLAAQDQVTLAMKVAGRIESITVDLGDPVRKGQIIATLDPTDLKNGVEQAAAGVEQARSRLGLRPDSKSDHVDPEQTASVRQARATYNEARLNRERAQKLFDAKLIPRSDLDTATANFQVAESRYQDAIEEIRNRQGVLAQRLSELALARQRLADAVLRSPIDGAVSEKQTSAGQYVAAGTPVATVVQMHPLRLRLPVPERAAVNVHVGQQVQLTVDGDRNTYYGRVTRLSPAIDESNRTLLVEAEVPNERGTLRPGSFVRAEVLAQANEAAIFVPASALVTFAGLEKVITVENGRTLEKQVKTGRKDKDNIEIAEGIQPGEPVVVRPGNLVGGQPVVIRR